MKTHATMLRAALALLSAGALCSCAEARPRLGDVNLVYGIDGLHRAEFNVEDGRIVSGWLDVATDGQGPDACVSGLWNSSSISLCPKELDASNSHFGGKLVEWSGPRGDLAIEVSPDGRAVRVDGWLSRESASGSRASDASVHGFGGRGGRYHDAYGLSDPGTMGSHARHAFMHITLPLGHGPQWNELRRLPVLYAVAAASIGLTRGEGVQPRHRPANERQANGPEDGAPMPGTPAPPAPPPPPPGAPNP